MAASASSARLNGWSEREIGTIGALPSQPHHSHQSLRARTEEHTPKQNTTPPDVGKPSLDFANLGRAGPGWVTMGRAGSGGGGTGPGGLWFPFFLNPRATCRPVDPLDRQVREDSTRPEPVLNGAFPLMRKPKTERKMGAILVLK